MKESTTTLFLSQPLPWLPLLLQPPPCSCPAHQPLALPRYHPQLLLISMASITTSHPTVQNQSNSTPQTLHRYHHHQLHTQQSLLTSPQTQPPDSPTTPHQDHHIHTLLPQVSASVLPTPTMIIFSPIITGTFSAP